MSRASRRLVWFPERLLPLSLRHLPAAHHFLGCRAALFLRCQQRQPTQYARGRTNGRTSLVLLKVRFKIRSRGRESALTSSETRDRVRRLTSAATERRISESALRRAQLKPCSLQEWFAGVPFQQVAGGHPRDFGEGFVGKKGLVRSDQHVWKRQQPG